MNISRHEQRVLHVLAQGGAIHFERGTNGKVRQVSCFTREGHGPADCTLALFERLGRRRLVRSTDGKPYRATRLGVACARSRPDNRWDSP